MQDRFLRGLDFDQVNLFPMFSSKFKSRSEVTLKSRSMSELLGVETTGIIAANMDGIGTFEVAKIMASRQCLTALHKHYTGDQLIDWFDESNSRYNRYTFYSMGMNQGDLDKFRKVLSNIKIAPNICIDVANGYMYSFHDFCKLISQISPDSVIMAGNVVTLNGALALIESGVDIVKVGIGPSAVCTTRAMTGIGYPQFSAVFDMNAQDDTGILKVCSDGGCKLPGDIAKAFAAGAKCVMIGSMLAGTDEGGGEVIEKDGKKFVQFYGMSSLTAQNVHGGTKNYRSSEGRTVSVPYRGKLEYILDEILGGLRSTCTYLNSEYLDELYCDFIEVKGEGGLNKMFDQYTIGK